jgi:predicted nucleotidyltransferase
MAIGMVERRAGERGRVTTLLRERADELRAQGVRGLALFGSVARNEARPDSDVDLLVDVDPEAGLGFGVVSLRRELGRVLGRPVGLAFASRVRPDMRARLERDLVKVS